MTKQDKQTLGIDCSADFHIHIGQFYQHYYSPKNVIQAVAECGIKRINFSDTSAGAGVQTREDALVLHSFMQNEVTEALRLCKQYNIEAKAYLWVVPEFWAHGYTLQKDLQTGLYSGLKLHPRFFFDRYSVKEQNAISEETFKTAREQNLPILIHTGVDENLDEPKRFEDFFERYQDVKVTLAHCKDYESCITYFAKYKNVFGDTAFCPEDAMRAIADAGFIERMYFGTDFPVTHYFNHRKESAMDDVPLKDLIAQYKADIA